MNTEIETPEAETTDLSPEERHQLRTLNAIYLDAGLPLDLAARAAIADYELFDQALICA